MPRLYLRAHCFMGLSPDTWNRRLHMRRECRERFPRHRLQRKPLVSDPGLHHGTCVTHVTWCVSGSLTSGGGENVPSIPGACVTHSFTYLASGPWVGAWFKPMTSIRVGTLSQHWAIVGPTSIAVWQWYSTYLGDRWRPVVHVPWPVWPVVLPPISTASNRLWAHPHTASCLRLLGNLASHAGKQHPYWCSAVAWFYQSKRTTRRFEFPARLVHVAPKMIWSTSTWHNEYNTLLLGLRPANERRRYQVTPSLIGWTLT